MSLTSVCSRCGGGRVRAGVYTGICGTCIVERFSAEGQPAVLSIQLHSERPNVNVSGRFPASAVEIIAGDTSLELVVHDS